MTKIHIDLSNDIPTLDSIIAKGDGKHLLGQDGHSIFYVKVHQEVVEYSATEHGHEAEVQVFNIQVQPVSHGGTVIHVHTPKVRCFVCVCVNDSCRCAEVPC